MQQAPSKATALSAEAVFARPTVAAPSYPSYPNLQVEDRAPMNHPMSAEYQREAAERAQKAAAEAARLRAMQPAPTMGYPGQFPPGTMARGLAPGVGFPPQGAARGVAPNPSFGEESVAKASVAEEDEAKKNEDEDAYHRKVSFSELFKYTTSGEMVLIAIAFVAAMGNGAALPVFTLFFKDLIDGGFSGGSELNVEQVEETAFKFLYLSCGLLLCGTIATGLLLYVASNSGQRLRAAYLHAILRQDIGWFDTTRTGEITTSMERDCANVQAAIGEKIAIFVQNMTTFFGGLVIGFTQGWEMALVLMASLPILAGAGAWMAINLASLTTIGEKAYRGGGGVAEQAISGVRTVQSLSGEEREEQRYSLRLGQALETGLKKARINGMGFGVVMGSFIGTYALGLWFGSWLIINNKTNTMTGKTFTGGDVIMCFFAVVMGSFSIGQVMPAFQAFTKGQSSAARIYDVIERKPPIDVSDTSGDKPSAVNGSIELRNVAFSYPSRPDAPIFQNLSLSIVAGSTAALVGASGSGKSTIIQLMLRFYDPVAGGVFLDGRDLRQLNLVWLRKSLGLVSQEPVLFARTIIDNIRFGKEDATLEDVRAACRKSNAAQFIESLPKQYDTMCGERGAQLSGGQKQRIAIARAIISNPKVLMLDEATSALDSESEKLVQQALDSLMDGRTVLVVAHRLSTIRNADNIVVFQAGVVVEQGRHDDLVKLPDGYYKELVAKQMMGGAEGAGEAGVFERQKSDQMEEKANVKAMSLDHPLSKEEKEAASKGKFVSRSFALNKPELPWAFVGVIGAIMNGAVFPVLATLLVEMLSAYFLCIRDDNDDVFSVYRYQSECDSDCWWDGGVNYFPGSSAPAGTLCSSADFGDSVCRAMDGGGFLRTYRNNDVCWDVMKVTVRNYSIGFAGLAAGAFIANFMQLFSFGLMGEHLTMRLRQLSFAAILRQNIGFFDLPENSTGALSVKLAKDASYVEGAVGTTLGLLIQNLSIMTISLVIAFVRGWMLTLICFATFPLMVLANYFQMQFIAGAGGDSNKNYQNAGGVASESIAGMRTVAAFSGEDKIETLFHDALHIDGKGVKKTALGAGVGQGFSLFAMFFLYFCGFAGGAFMMRNHGYTFEDVMTVFFSITFMGMGAGQAAALAPDIGKAKPAMINIFTLIDKVPTIDTADPGGQQPAQVRGEIELRNVSFHYPSRPDCKIFDNLSLTIAVGKTVALVGSSGSGKSTVISLVERFYDPTAGQVLLDGIDLRKLNVKWLRSSLGLVSQEPVLFATSIMENIKYGKASATPQEVQDAAHKANAMQFISKLPQGFETMCGERGTQLSGGQKQRIAIARAIVSNPKILLLDEATSALDSQSEKIVQSALDNLMAGRTVIVVAHRLSTIRGADRIVCFKKGVVVESGSHDDLIGRGSFYTNLVSAQMNSV